MPTFPKSPTSAMKEISCYLCDRLCSQCVGALGVFLPCCRSCRSLCHCFTVIQRTIETGYRRTGCWTRRYLALSRIWVQRAQCAICLTLGTMSAVRRKPLAPSANPLRRTDHSKKNCTNSFARHSMRKCFVKVLRHRGQPSEPFRNCRPCEQLCKEMPTENILEENLACVVCLALPIYRCQRCLAVICCDELSQRVGTAAYRCPACRADGEDKLVLDNPSSFRIELRRSNVHTCSTCNSCKRLSDCRVWSHDTPS